MTDAVLVVRPSSLGDIVHASALIADIRTHRPELAIDWVAEEAFVALVALDRRVRRTIPIAFRRWRHHLFQRSTWREMTTLRDDLRSESYRAVLDLQEQVKSAFIACLARGTRHGPDRASIREPLATYAHDAHHAIDRNQHLIDRCRQLAGAALGYRVSGPPRFQFEPPRQRINLGFAHRYVVFVHATSRIDKLWPEAHWHSLVDWFGERGHSIVLPWGDAPERNRSERIARRSKAAHVLDKQALSSIARVLCDAALVIGVDTGLVHLAAALGTPTIALFVATDPALAGAARASVRARDLGGMGCIPSAEEVQATADTLLAQRVATT